jgi:hypothetical protein
MTFENGTFGLPSRLRRPRERGSVASIEVVGRASEPRGTLPRADTPSFAKAIGCLANAGRATLALAPGPLAEVDRWIEKQKEPPSRPEAIRRLVELGLKAKGK